ncbi:hypothetical protein [Nocardia bovistercoris]|uniref:Uncharacterized protein n=1 Tax=Nocardia bovistercoris TaxID=2785916 RepID=A0A931I709_9NOCA|nr:hypothetical protein [Nocardia bovistercoris]MBH0775063.1 hypothetical protein [Nocardia bovistercoris]
MSAVGGDMSRSGLVSSGVVYASPNSYLLALRLAALVPSVLLLVGMAGCALAWVDLQDSVPSLDVCRAVDAGVPAEPPGSCVPREQLPSGVSR